MTPFTILRPFFASTKPKGLLLSRMTFLTKDGDTFEADNLEALVVALREASHTPAATLQDYVRETAARSVMQSGCPHRDDTPAHLAEDLLASGLIQSIA